ncbi:MAG TPA: YceH family protein [Bryobacteraceae bacterium]
MDLELDAAEARVLGSLLEKEIATPEYYPLSLNALVNACNQKSNRDPVVAYDDDTVEEALDRLREKGLVLRVTGRDSRVPKHEQRFTEKFNLGRREAAIICVLLLRGPQTVGELRGRTERLYTFDDLEAVESTLNRLGEMEFTRQLPRQPGYKEQRYAHLLSGEVEAAAMPEAAPAPAAERGTSGSQGDRERIAALEEGLAALRREFEEFRRNFQ